MRKKEREITDMKEMEDIIGNAQVLHLGLAVENTPYVIPVNFGYREKIFYVHCAHEGRKMDMIKQNNRVCFQLDVDMEITNKSDTACTWSTAYRSIIGYGNATILDNPEEKKDAMNIIMKHYSGKDSFEYKAKAIERVAIIKITVDEISGKKTS
ncbi:MAG: pyridoxamine 5'-phosphate oxidase family protein [bacterium]|nr:pyridoxamine 5'-phosphate oxidase family protein [bacterium]